MTPEEFVVSATTGKLGKHELATAVAGVTDGTLDSDQWLPRFHEVFPFAEVSHLIFWSDRVRTSDEIADEIFLRKELFLSGGDVAIRDRLVALAKAALADADRPPWAHNWANIVLDGGGRSEILDTTSATDPSFDRVAGLWTRSSDETLELTLNGIAILSSASEPINFRNYRVEGDALVLHDPATGTERHLRIDGRRLFEADLAPYVLED